MGSWGVGIFSNDDVAGIRDDFRDLIADGLSAMDATKRLQDEYGVERGVHPCLVLQVPWYRR